LKTLTYFLAALFVALLLAAPAFAQNFDTVGARQDLKPMKAITYGSGTYHTGAYSPYAEAHETWNPALAPTLGSFTNDTTTGHSYNKSGSWTQPGEVRNVKVVTTKFTQLTGIKPVTVHGWDLNGARQSEVVNFNKSGWGVSKKCFRGISSVVSDTRNNKFGNPTSGFTIYGGKRFGFANQHVVVCHKRSFNGAGVTVPTVDAAYNCYSTTSALDGSKREEVWYKHFIEPYRP